MASIDANVLSGATGGRHRLPPPRRCGNCNQDMVQLGAFPAIAGREAVVIFRCYGCNYVVSEDDQGRSISSAKDRSRAGGRDLPELSC
jgi:hypothetical protein